MTPKATFLGGALVLTLGLGATGAALAQDGDDRGQGPRGPGFGFFVQQFDQDGDGAVSREEIEAVRAERFAEADTNGDGVLSQDEAFAAAEARRAERELTLRQSRAAAMFERLDKNGDGALSEEELAAAPGPERMFDRIDADGDGVLSAEELEAAQDRFAERRGKWGRHHGEGHHKRGEGRGPSGDRDDG